MMKNHENKMVLDLRQVFEVVDTSVPFDYNMDLTEYSLFSLYPFQAPVHVKGTASNNASIVTLSFTTEFVLDLNCDRCLTPFKSDFTYLFNETLVTELNTDNEDDYIVVENGSLLLDEVVLPDILLSLPSKLLCDPDCKGLCAHCGVNFNEAECHCKKKEIDPRLAALSDLL